MILLLTSLAQAADLEHLSRPGLYRAGQITSAVGGGLILGGVGLGTVAVAGPGPDNEPLFYGSLVTTLVGAYGLCWGPWISGMAVKHDIPDHPTWPGQIGATIGNPIFALVQVGQNRAALSKLNERGLPLDDELDRELERMERREEWLEEELRYLEELEEADEDGASWLDGPPQLGQAWALREHTVAPVPDWGFSAGPVSWD